jgi:hypothetical protein
MFTVRGFTWNKLPGKSLLNISQLAPKIGLGVDDFLNLDRSSHCTGLAGSATLEGDRRLSSTGGFHVEHSPSDGT